MQDKANSEIQNDFYCIALSEFLSAENGEEFAENKISSFSSLNEDVEDFLKHSAIQACKLKTSSTFFILDDDSLKGYFTLAIKILNFPKDNVSASVERVIKRFGNLNTLNNCYEIPAVLIAQISKNFSEKENQLAGHILISYALDRVKEIFKLAGGKTVFLECEDNSKLLSFYERNGFKPLGSTRQTNDKKELLQLYRII